MSVKTVQAIVNGVTVTLTYNSTTGKYEGTFSAPSKSSYNVNSGHYYPVTVLATDDADNVTEVDATDSNLGSSLQLIVKEKVAPVITITSPTAGAFLTDGMPSITWTVTDDDSGVNPDTISLLIDNGTAINGASIVKTKITNGYSCSYTPGAALTDGSHTIAVNASDYDGNAATKKSVTFTIDTVPPTLSISAPAEGLVTNEKICVVKGTTNDATSGSVTVKIQINSMSPQSVTVNADGTFSHTLTLASGVNTIKVTATDKAGVSTTVVRTVTLDTGAPVIHSITITPNPVDAGKTCIISVEVTD